MGCSYMLRNDTKYTDMVLHIEMTNCFGIKQLMLDFDYSGKFTHSIYAPNGTMKTSFAKTMRFVSKQSKTKP